MSDELMGDPQQEESFLDRIVREGLVPDGQASQVAEPEKAPQVEALDELDMGDKAEDQDDESAEVVGPEQQAPVLGGEGGGDDEVGMSQAGARAATEDVEASAEDGDKSSSGRVQRAVDSPPESPVKKMLKTGVVDMDETPKAGGCHGGAAAQNAQAGGGVGHEAPVQVGPGGPEGQGDRQAYLDDKVQEKLKELLAKGDLEGAESLRRIFGLLPSGQQPMKGSEGSEKLGEAALKVHDEVVSESVFKHFG